MTTKPRIGLTVGGDHLAVTAPESRELSALMRSLDGRFSHGSWKLDRRHEDVVRETLERVYPEGIEQYTVHMTHRKETNPCPES